MSAPCQPRLVRFLRTAVAAAVVVWAGLASAADPLRFERAGGVRLAAATEGSAVDLAADLERVLGVRGVRVAPAAIRHLERLRQRDTSNL